MAKVGKNLRRALANSIHQGQQRELVELLGTTNEQEVLPIDMAGLYHAIEWGHPELPEQMRPQLGHKYPPTPGQVAVQLVNEWGTTMLRRTYRAEGVVPAPFNGRMLYKGAPLLLVLTVAQMEQHSHLRERYPESWAALTKMAMAGTIKAKVQDEWSEIESTVRNYFAAATSEREAVTLWPAIGLLTRGSNKINPVAPYKKVTLPPARNTELWRAAIGADRPGVTPTAQTQDEMTAKLVTYLALTQVD